MDIGQPEAGWSWCSLRILVLEEGGSHTFATAGEEMILLPLAGSATVTCQVVDGHQSSWALAGRPDVFAGPTDFVYLPPGSAATVGSTAGGHFALAGAMASGPSRLATRRPGRHR